MKAIAEYFRDLASEDRFFGAEPPTPDVQMLHAIAQKSSEKPVDAEMAENGLRLTQTPEAAPAQPEVAAAAPAPVGADEEGTDSVPATPTNTASEREPDASATTYAADTWETAEEPVSAATPIEEDDDRVETFEAVAEVTDTPGDASEPHVAAEMVELAAAEDAYAEDSDLGWSFEAEDEQETAEDVFDAEDDENLFADIADSTDTADWSATTEEAVAEEEVFETEDVTTPSFAQAVIYAEDDVEDIEPLVDAASFAEDAPVDDEDVAALFQIEETAPEVPVKDAIAATTDTPEETGLSASSIAAKLQRIRSVVAASVSGLGSGQKSSAVDDMAETDDLTDDMSYALEEDNATDSVLVEDGFITAQSLEEPQNDADTAEFYDLEDESFEPEQSLEDELAEIEQDVEAPRRGVALELSDEDLIAAAAMARPRNAPRPKAFERTLEAEAPEADMDLSTTAEEDLRNDLAAIEEDLAEADLAKAEADAEEAAEMRRLRAQESLGEDAAGNNDETVERLLSQTNSKLNDDTTQRRQSALAHLKAAVAATIADRVSPKDSDAPEDIDETADDYRKDLASIVRPRSVDVSEDDAEMDTGDGPDTAEIEPLVLVPQARIEPETQVRPRRINRSEKADLMREQASGFADYAEEVGAQELHDLLEAAAAYLSTVEGKEHFSRPEVMHMVMRHDRDRAFSREAQLRSFGDLLRNGTIEKVNRGQFVISTDSRYVAAG
ncbi:hypothetical protein [Tropicimonas sp. S265A]|uniref:hypothetical protein n=1 Tax=Tropicimonas sp. S265A TaxID=3415134 RepID=UPI003C7A1C94